MSLAARIAAQQDISQQTARARLRLAGRTSHRVVSAQRPVGVVPWSASFMHAAGSHVLGCVNRGTVPASDCDCASVWV